MCVKCIENTLFSISDAFSVLFIAIELLILFVGGIPIWNGATENV